MQNIVIDKEFQSLIPPLTKEEYEGLEQSILSEGCRDALVVWEEYEVHYNDLTGYTDVIPHPAVIIDGHNRYEICTRHNIPFNTVYADLSDRDEVKLWMMKNQLARRNLNDFQRIEIAHKCEDAVKAKARERQGERNDLITSEKNFSEVCQEVRRATNELGKMAGVSHKTYEHAVTVMEEAPKPVVDAARRNDLSINAAYQVTKLEPEQQQEIARRIENIHEETKETQTPKAIIQDVIHKPHVSNNSGNNEWYTPKKYVDAARRVLGNIDLDPASCAYANETVRAEKFFSVDDDGLTKEWHGKVWMNPPYNSESVVKFTEKFVDEYQVGNTKEGIVLVNNATETSWFTNMVNAAAAVVFSRGRIRYESATRESLSPLQGQAFLYFGQNIEKFLNEFSEIGWGAIIK